MLFLLFASCLVALTAVAARSPLFAVKLIEIRNLPEGAPVLSDELIQRTGVRLGLDNLYSLRFSNMEKGLMEEPWIRSVRIERQPPQSLVVEVELRQPVAIVQGKDSRLHWLDQDAKVFGEADPQAPGSLATTDLPMISGDLPAMDKPQGRRALEEVLQFLAAWKAEMTDSAGRVTELSSLSFSKERGWKAWVTYRVPGKGAALEESSRVSIDLGASLAVSSTVTGAPGDTARLPRIRSVLAHIRQNRIPARHLFADGDKKIVVKLMEGS
jgi:hypothetical protein